MEEKLSSVHLKIERAKKHFNDLKWAIEAFEKSGPCEILAHRDPESRRMVYCVNSVKPVPKEIPIILGDLIHTVRSALDHLAFQLWMKAGKPGKERNVYFPILSEKPKTGFKPEIEGMGKAIVDTFNSIEPYKGGKGNPLWILNELNNTDKHRMILAIIARFGGADVMREALANMSLPPGLKVPKRAVFVRGIGTPSPLKSGDELYRSAPDAQFDKDQCFSIQVSIQEPGVVEGEPVLPFLRQLDKFVMDTIATFEKFL